MKRVGSNLTKQVALQNIATFFGEMHAPLKYSTYQKEDWCQDQHVSQNEIVWFVTQHGLYVK